MTPAYRSTLHALLAGLLLAFLLTLPVTLRLAGMAPLEQSYRGISERAGAFDYTRVQIFENHAPLDILFCGTSLFRNAIDPRYVRAELAKALGRDAEVVLAQHAWQGPDLDYYMVRDFLEHRKVKMVVIPAPAFMQRSAQPHAQLFRVVRYGDHPGALDGLALRSRMAIYAEYVLGGPRQVLNLFRANRVDPEASREIAYGTRIGYMGGPFVERSASPAALNAAAFAVADTSSSRRFRLDGPPLNGYQLHFLRKIEELARSHGALLVILHMPSPRELGETVIPWQRDIAELDGPGVVFGGIASVDMFRGVPPEWRLDYFEDEHLNINGRTLFIQEVTPALISLYERIR